MGQLRPEVAKRTGDWPRRVDTSLFVDEQPHGIGWPSSSAALFGFLATKTGRINWHKGVGFITKEEFYAELRRTATRYDSVESLPHEPALPTHYYACGFPAAGDGAALAGLLERFCPATDIDGDLLKGMFASAFWGGPGGTRPAFIITSDEGRGSGKSKAAAMLGYLAGGVIDLSANEDISTIKQRLLSPAGLPKRVALLDNVKSLKFSWAELEALITAATISGKQMFVGESDRPNTLLYVLTLNGASLSTDMAQRAVIIKIRKPAHSGTWEEETRAYIDARRAAIVSDLIGFLRRPPAQLQKFTRWGMWERSVLARLPEPEEAQALILERQGTADVEAEESEIIEDFFAGQLAALGYHDVDRVHVPSATATRWFNWASNQNATVTAVSRMLTQMATEGKLRRLSVNKCRTHGRGFVWATADVDGSIWTDLQKRIADQKAKSA